MTILNTTFHVHCTVQRPFIEWIREVYEPTALATGSFTSPQLERVLGGDDPEGTSFAHRMISNSLAEAKRWHDKEGAGLREEMTKRFGQKALFFTTYLDVVE